MTLTQWAEERTTVKSFNVRTEVQKVTHWKAVDRRRSGWIRAIRSQVAKQFASEREAVAAAVRGADSMRQAVERAVRAVDAGADQWERLYKGLYLTVGKDFANGVWKSFGLKTSFALMQRKADLEDEWTREVVNYIRRAGAVRVVGVTETTKDKLRKLIAEGIENGDTIPNMADQIEELYAGFQDYRAERIARTEVVGASNLGSQVAARVTGLTLVKEWISTRDDRTRGADEKDKFDHVAVDGQRRAMDEVYSVSGERLLFPGDSAYGASAGNVINCRCVEAYARPEDLD